MLEGVSRAQGGLVFAVTLRAAGKTRSGNALGDTPGSLSLAATTWTTEDTLRENDKNKKLRLIDSCL